MTAPNLSKTTRDGRFYTHPTRQDEVPSITNITGMLDKSKFLTPWAARKVAEFAADNMEALQGLDRASKIDLLKGSPYRSSGAAGDTGDIVHDWVDQYIQGIGPDPDEVAKASSTARGMWKQFGGMCAKYNPEWICSETTVWSDTHAYAGTLDWMAKIAGAVVLGDTKCMVPETLVTMADGTEKAAGDIHHGEFVAAWDGEKIVSSRVVACGDNGVQPVVKISTAHGRYLTVTLDHPILTDDGLVKAGDLVKGNLVSVAGATGETDNPMSPDDAYFIGLILGDGGLSHHQVNMTTMDPLIVRFMESYARDRDLELSRDSSTGGGRASTYRIVRPGGFQWSGKRNPITQMFREMGLMGVKSGTKFVPDAVMSGGREAWTQFMAGYLDTDGHIRTPEHGSSFAILWTSKSEKMLRQCQSILTGLGIRSRVYPIVGVLYGVKRRYWQLAIGSRSAIRKFQSIIPERGERTMKLRNLLVPELTSPQYSHIEPDGFDTVISTEQLPATSTVWLEVAGTHMHVTNGINTHNTGNRVYPEVGMQLGALNGADYAFQTNTGEQYQLPKAERFAVLHLRPRSFTLVPIVSIDECFDCFLALRQAFEWKTQVSERVIQFAPKIEVK